jgi:hypothetical protein
MLQNIPFFCLLWIGLGFVFVTLGIFMLISHSESHNQYTEFSNQKVSGEYTKEVGELFSYFLEEEEKKNEGLREMLLEAVSKKEKNVEGLEASSLTAMNLNPISNRDKMKAVGDISNNHTVSTSNSYNEMIKLYESGLGIEEIAKKLKKGVGEVNLLISLYTMR